MATYEYYVGNSTNTTANTTTLTYATFTSTSASPAYTVYNGDINNTFTSSIFQSVEDRIKKQQEAYEEPRDHCYNPGVTIFDMQCQDCKPHNMHRFDPGKHLYVIDEEIDWLLQLCA